MIVRSASMPDLNFFYRKPADGERRDSSTHTLRHSVSSTASAADVNSSPTTQQQFAEREIQRLCGFLQQLISALSSEQNRKLAHNF